MAEFLEVITRTLVIILYAGTFAMAVRGLLTAHLWARKVALITILVTSLCWIAFYVYLLGVDFHGVDPSSGVSMMSRIFHYVTATGLYISASLIVTSETVNGQTE
jgi:hypothetical protein